MFYLKNVNMDKVCTWLSTEIILWPYWGTVFLLCMNIALAATFLGHSAAAILILHHHCRVKCIYLHYRRSWKCSSLAWIHLISSVDFVFKCPHSLGYQLQKLNLAVGSCHSEEDITVIL